MMCRSGDFDSLLCAVVNFEKSDDLVSLTITADNPFWRAGPVEFEVAMSNISANNFPLRFTMPEEAVEGTSNMIRILA